MALFGGGGRALQPYQIAVPEADLADLRARLSRARWPAEPRGSTDSYGVPLGRIKQLAAYWRDRYDWRAWEARLNEHPQFMTTIDGTNVYFLHVRSPWHIRVVSWSPQRCSARAGYCVRGSLARFAYAPVRADEDGGGVSLTVREETRQPDWGDTARNNTYGAGKANPEADTSLPGYPRRLAAATMPPALPAVTSAGRCWCG